MRSIQLLSVCLICIPQLAWADLQTNVGISVGLLQVCSFPSSGFTSCSVDGVVPENVNMPKPLGMIHVFGTASATASYGELQIAADLSSSGGSVDEYGIGLGASFSDTLTVSGYSGAGFIQYGLGYDGSTAFLSTNFVPGWAQPLELNGNSPSSQLYPFVAGDPFPLTLGFDFGFTSDITGGCFCNVGSWSVAIDQIHLFDANMNPLTGYSLTAASGTLYPAVGAAVPEPSALLLLATAAIALGCRRVLGDTSESRRVVGPRTSTNDHTGAITA